MTSQNFPILSPAEPEKQNRGSSISQPNPQDLREIGTKSTNGSTELTTSNESVTNIRIFAGDSLFADRRGFTLIELIVYIALVALIAVVTTNTILILNKTIGAFRLERRLAASAETSMRRIIREVHLANDIHASSTLGVSPGVLSLASHGSEDDAAPKNVMLYVDDAGALILRRATSSPVVLTGQNVAVTNIVFRQINNGTVSRSVKTELTLRASSGSASTTRNYYVTTVLRGSY